MTLSLHTIKPAKGSTKNRKRVGRGNASGHGTSATRGTKGQKSRSGVTGLKRLGLKMTLARLPKKRGFKSLKPKNQVINILLINDNFKDGDEISAQSLFKKGLIQDANASVKILGNGELKLKNIKFKNVKMSQSASAQISKDSASVK